MALWLQVPAPRPDWKLEPGWGKSHIGSCGELQILHLPWVGDPRGQGHGQRAALRPPHTGQVEGPGLPGPAMAWPGPHGEKEGQGHGEVRAS